VRCLEEQKRDEQRRRVPDTIDDLEKAFVFDPMIDRHYTLEYFYQQILVRFDLFFSRKHHLYSGDYQKSAENIYHPMELHQCRTERDECRTKHESTQNAVKKYAVLVFCRNAEITEYKYENEDIIDRKRI